MPKERGARVIGILGGLIFSLCAFAVKASRTLRTAMIHMCDADRLTELSLTSVAE